MNILVTGCFDVLHAGHIRLLKFAAQMGHVIVGVNSDRRVNELKGPGRPIVDEQTRLEVAVSVAGYAAVGYIFDEDTASELIRKLTPDVWVKGMDYLGQEVEEIAACKEVGCAICYFPHGGESTTKLLEKGSEYLCTTDSGDWFARYGSIRR